MQARMEASPSRVTDVHAQHEEILRLLEALRRATRAPDAETAPALLERLEHALRQHFALEEQGGYFAEELERAPQIAGTVTHLQNEHLELMTRLREIRGQTGGAPTVESVEAFARRLRDHETAENRLMQDTYLEDEGGG